MLKNKKIQSLCRAAVCAALSVVFGKLLQIPIGDSVRISFENLPILFASLALGSVWGGIVGLVADLVGCAVMGYTVNPFITLGAVLVGVLPHLLLKSKERFSSVFFAVFFTHVVASMVVKSFGLYLYYQTPVSFLLLRVLVACVLSVAESVILYHLFSSSAFSAGRGGR